MRDERVKKLTKGRERKRNGMRDGVTNKKGGRAESKAVKEMT